MCAVYSDFTQYFHIKPLTNKSCLQIYSQGTMGNSNKMYLLLVLIVVQALVAQVPQVYCRPGKIYDTPVTAKPYGCAQSATVDELCQQCAKHTKSNIVYPLCCGDEEDAQSFCRKYLDFGL